MEYEDEIERMRRRRQHQRAEGQKRTRSQEAELNVIEFDDLESERPRKRQPGRRHAQTRNYDYETVYDYEDLPRKTRRPSVRKASKDNRDRKRGNAGKNKKKRGFGFLKIFFLLAVFAGVYFGYRYIQGGTGVWTIAVFGVDSRNGSLEKGALSDVEMLCVIDRKTGEIKLVSVYRDTYLEISPDGTYHKINEAYFKGGHEQAVEALERNLDLTIDDYATFNWKAVADAITILGGIDLEISDSEFKYINAFITETVESTGLGSHHLEHAGMNHLDGVQAVAYARLRLMDTDYNRTARQRLVIQLAMNKAKEADFKTLSIVAKTVIPQLSTSISLDDIIPMARNIKKYHIGETGGFPFSRGETHIGKKDCVIPLTLESNVVQLHHFLYGTEGYQPSATVKQISAQIAADSGMGEVADNAPEARIAGQKALEEGSENGDSSQASGGETPETNPAPAEAETPASRTEGSAPEPSIEEGDMESSEESSSEEGSSESEESSSLEPAESSEEESESVEAAESQSEVSAQTPDGPGQTQTSPGSSGPAGPGDADSPAGPGMSPDIPNASGSTNPGEKPVSKAPEVGPGVP